MLSFIAQMIRWVTSATFIFLLGGLLFVYSTTGRLNLWALLASIALALTLTIWLEAKWNRWARSDPARRSYDERFGPRRWQRFLSRDRSRGNGN